MIRSITVRGLRIQLDVESKTEAWRADTYESKEPETLHWIDTFFHPGDVFFDVGANIGLYSLYAAQRLKGQCSVYSFEPEALNYAKLNCNVRLNGLSGTVLPCCAAISDTLALAPLNLHPCDFDLIEEGSYEPGSSMHSFGSVLDFEDKAFTPYHVQLMFGVSLDLLCGTFGLPVPNHIKIDVDGHEDKVMRGLSGLLADRSLRSVLVELNLKDGKNLHLKEQLFAAGFAEYLDSPEHSDTALKGSPWEGTSNRIFIRE